MWLIYDYIVPVVVVFTKYEALLDQVANDMGITKMTEDAQVHVNEIAEARFQERCIARIMNTAHPPKSFTRLQGERKPYDKDCYH